MAGPSRMELWSDRIHPVIVRELRRTVRSGSAIGTMLMGGTMVGMVMIWQLGRFGGGVSPTRPLGRDVFMMLMVLLYLIALVHALAQTGIRIRSEREPGAIDLLYATPLTAASIIWAKLFCGLYEAFLVFSLGLPMLFLTTLLRGVDVMTVLLSLVLAVPLIAGPLEVAIFTGSLHLGKTMKGVVSLLAMIVVVPVSLAIFSGCVAALVFGGFGRFFATVMSGEAIGVGFIYLMVVAALHGVSVSLLASPGGRQGPGVREMQDAPNYHF